MFDPVGATRFIGIDVSAEQLDVTILPVKTSFTVRNSPAGWKQLIARVRQAGDRPLIVLEATGRYHVGLCLALEAAALTATIVNPKRIRDFAKSHGILGKTDRVDATVMAVYAQERTPTPTPLPPAHVRKLQALVGHRADLVKERTRYKNRRHAADPALYPLIDGQIAFLKEQIAAVDQLIADHIASHPDLRARVAALQSVPGIAAVTSAVLAARLAELGTAPRRQITSLAGVAAYANDSGKQHGIRTTRAGRRDVTVALYQAVITMVRWNPVLATYYHHLIQEKQKKHKVAIIACCRRLLGLLTAMLRDGLMWQDLAIVNAHQTA